MKLFTNKKQLQTEIRKFNNISFVPTMGALHKGHESIIRKSVKGSGKTLVSIFVNPKQFNSKKDLNTYPRNNNSDLKMLKRLKVHYLYKPSYGDIYKFKTEKKIYLDRFSNELCGQFRKGHFKGVIDVVNRFLEIIRPKTIVLGKKDLKPWNQIEINNNGWKEKHLNNIESFYKKTPYFKSYFLFLKFRSQLKRLDFTCPIWIFNLRNNYCWTS